MAKYLDYNGLKKYDELLKKWHAADQKELEDKIAAIIGSDSDSDFLSLSDLRLTHDADMAELRNLIADITGESESMSSIAELNQRIAELTSAVGTINNGDTGRSMRAVAGEVAEKAAQDEVAKIVDNAPAAFDTLKEIADWINSDGSAAAGLVDDVAQNTANIQHASDSIKSANDRIDALESILGSASDSDSVIDRLGDIEAKHAADVTNIYNAINNIKQDDDSPIPESEIAALFPQA